MVRAVRYALERARLQADRVALERRLAHAQRLESLGRFAGGIAHELNNRLTPIIGMADLQRAMLPEGHKARMMTNTILAAAEEATTLVRNLLTYARHQPNAEKTSVDLAETIAQSTAVLRATLPPKVQLQVELADRVSLLEGNPGQLLNVVLNLLANAVDAMAGRGGTIRLTLDEVDRRDVVVPVNPPLLHPRYVRLAVRDDGIGMSAETLARVFDPFFTSKAVDKGSGLGLSVVHGIVLDHQGAIAISSAPGRGTDVQIFLPTCQ